MAFTRLREAIRCHSTQTTHRIPLKSMSQKRQKEGTEASCCVALNYLLEMHATNDIIPETDDAIMQFTQIRNKSGTEYV